MKVKNFNVKDLRFKELLLTLHSSHLISIIKFSKLLPGANSCLYQAFQTIFIIYKMSIVYKFILKESLFYLFYLFFSVYLSYLFSLLFFLLAFINLHNLKCMGIYFLSCPGTKNHRYKIWLYGCYSTFDSITNSGKYVL